MLPVAGSGPGAPAAAQMLDRYQIDGCIGRGGMAEVYHGRLLRMGGFEREVAVKVLLPQLGGEAEFVNMLLDEARIAATITHPNVVQVLDVGQAHEVFYLVMEYVDGIDLRSVERRHERGRVPEEPLLYIIAEVLRGLWAIHQARDAAGQPRQIVHRDVTPSNVLITRSGSVKLADFGIAHATGRLTHTRHGAVKGKTRYMAPEQLDGRTIDHRTDLFAVGVVLLEALLGRDAAEAWHATAMGPIFKIPVRLPPSMDADVRAVLTRALHPSTDERYQDAAEFRRDVLKLLQARAGRGGELVYGADELERFIVHLMAQRELPTPRRTEAERPPPAEEPSDPSVPPPPPAGTSSILALALAPEGQPEAQTMPPAPWSPSLSPRPASAELAAAAWRNDAVTRPVSAEAAVHSQDLPTATVARRGDLLAPATEVDAPGVTLRAPVRAPTGPQAPTMTLPMLSTGAAGGGPGTQATASLIFVAGGPGESTTPLGPPPGGGPPSLSPEAPRPLLALDSLFDEPQPATVITASLHGSRPEALAVGEPTPHEPSDGRGAPHFASDIRGAAHFGNDPSYDLRPRSRLYDTLREGFYRAGNNAALATMITTLRGTVMRLSQGNLRVKIIAMVVSGILLGCLGLFVLHLQRGADVTSVPPPTPPPAPAQVVPPPTPPAPPRKGLLQVQAPAGTRVTIDGVAQPELAPRTYEVAPGPHKIRLSAPRHRDVLRSVDVPADQPAQVRF